MTDFTGKADLNPPAPDVRSIGLDVCEEAAWVAAIESIIAAAGRLDLLVNCVGVSAGSPLNLVSPAGVKTPMWGSMPFFQELVRTLGSEDAAYASMTGAGGGTFIEPAVARVVCFLLSDGARDMTVVELPVDEGYVL